MNPDDLADLEEQRAFLVRSLDDLDRELGAGDIDALDAATLRDDYTHRLAEVQRAIETGRAALADQVPPRRRSRVVAVVAVVAVLALGAGVAVANAAGSRKPGESATGTIRETSADKLSQAAGLSQDGKILEALKLYDQVLKQDPQNVDALVGRGLTLVRATMGTGDTSFAKDGEVFIRKALALQPDDPITLFYLGLSLRQQGRNDEARAALDQALAHHPPAALKQQMEQFRAGIGSS